MTTMASSSSIEEEESNWSEIPCDVLYLIMNKLSKTPHDYIRFRSVCFSWNSVPDDHVRHQYSQLPLLMAPPTSSFSNHHHNNNMVQNKNKKYKTKLRTFYNISDFKVDVRFKGITMPRYRQCRGSSHGWLITVDDDVHKSFPVRLFNPFFFLSSSLSGSSGNGTMEIVLPSLHTFPITHRHHQYFFKAESYEYLSKAVLSANPISNPTDYKVMAIYSGCFKLAFFKSGDKAWADVDGGESGYQDVIYYQGKFLVVDYEGTVVVCDDVAEGHGMTARILLQPPKVTDNYPTRILVGTNKSTTKYVVQSMYIVESSRGTLLQVQRNILSTDETTAIYSTVGFRVFELVHDHPIITDAQIGSQLDGLPGDYYEWVELKSLCGDTIFLGHSTSISISASDHYPGCKPNSIYYVDDSDFFISDTQSGPHDMGVFNLEDGSFERNFLLDHNDNSSIVPIWPVPIWIQPTLPK